MRVLFLKRMQSLKRAFPGDIVTYSLYSNFQELGFETKMIGLNNIGPRSLAVISQGMPNSPLRKASIKRVGNIIDVFKPDVIFTAFQDREILKLARSTPIVHWLLEYRMEKGGEDRFSTHFEESCARVISGATSDGPYEFLPFAVDQQLFKPLQSPKTTYPVSFTGSWYSDREEKFNHMLYPLGGLAHTFGRDWPKDVSGVNHHRQVDPSRLSEIYSSSAISLNIHHPGVAAHGGLNLRTFEILACGGLMICDHVSGMEKFLNPNRDFILYDGSVTITELVHRYSASEEGRKIADNGYKRFLSEHTMRQRAKRIAEIMRSL
jgi:hypothetical protein